MFKIFAILVLISIIIYTNVFDRKSQYTGKETTFTGIVYKKKIKEDKIIYYIKAKENLIVNYYLIEEKEISIGDTITVTGELIKPSKNTIPNIFNYQKYLYNHGINYMVKSKSIEKKSNNTNIIFHLRKLISKRIDNIKYGNEYIKIFILGDTSSLDEELIGSYQQNGVSHLFSISGMHISLFAGIILYIIKRISYNNFYNYAIVISFLIFYSLLVGSSPSVMRSLTMYILFSINKLFNLKIKSIDIMCMVLIILLLIKPFYIYDISFQFSYIISFSLVLFSYKLKNIKNKILKSLYISLISFLVSFPICIYNFYQVNIFSIILNIILIPFVSATIFPLSLISFIIPFTSGLLNIAISLLQSITLFVSNNNIGILSFSKPNIILIIIYYVTIYLFLYNKKNRYIFLVMLFHKIYIYIDNTMKINYLDVSQGDSIFIKFPNNESNILIDTGGITNSSYSISKNKTIPYLKSIGVTKVNYLIITHGDYDHMGEAINLIENYKVDNVIFNCGEFNNLEKNLIKILNKNKIRYYSCINELNINNYKLQFLNTKIYNNENDNSSVIYLNYNNYKFLFMGDAGVDKEKDILEKYNVSKIDVLKIGHHGSKTSSDKNFIYEINPKYSVISVGKKNRYGHPNKEVLNNLDNSKIYRTDQDGSIMFKIKNNKLKIEACSP